MDTEPGRRPSRDAVRRQILDAALVVLVERGFDRSSLDAVAHRAGFTKGAVYSNFSSKDDLFLALMQHQVELRVKDIESRIRTLPTPLTSEEFGRALASAATESRNWQLVFLEYWARAVRDPAVRARFVSHRRLLRDAIADALSSVRPAGDGQKLAMLAMILSNGFAIEALVDDGCDPALIGTTWSRVVSNAL